MSHLTGCCATRGKDAQQPVYGQLWVWFCKGLPLSCALNIQPSSMAYYAYNALGMCVGNVQKLASAGGLRNREMQYVPDFLNAAGRELMAYETGAGSIRTVFGHDYQRLSQSAAGGKTFFQSDIYGSPLFAADGQGTVQQYAERSVWGRMKEGTEVLPGLEENLRFTSYRYGPVIGKHFAYARFYDDAVGRMLALDPVKGPERVPVL